MCFFFQGKMLLKVTLSQIVKWRIKVLMPNFDLGSLNFSGFTYFEVIYSENFRHLNFGSLLIKINFNFKKSYKLIALMPQLKSHVYIDWGIKIKIKL